MEYISCYWYTLRKFFFFWLYYQSSMACLSILNYTLPFSSFNSSYDWNSRHESWKKYCFHVLEGKEKSITLSQTLYARISGITYADDQI